MMTSSYASLWPLTIAGLIEISQAADQRIWQPLGANQALPGLQKDG